MAARGGVLLAAAEILDDNAGEWGRDLSVEEGKTLAEGIGEVRRAAQILRYYGNEGTGRPARSMPPRGPVNRSW